MIIKNKKQLEKTQLRKDALDIIEAGYEAIKVENIYANQLKLDGDVLTIHDTQYNLADYENIYVVGLGKGAALAAKALEKVLGANKVSEGYVIDIAPIELEKIEVLKGTHPLPSEQNIEDTKKIYSLLKKANEKDLVISIICGGGSALLCMPDNMTCLELQFLSSMLLRSGASITEINTVRKHVSLIHGGYIAQYAYPATLLSLIISDVPGDEISMVASGPTVMDETTKEDADTVIEKYQLPKAIQTVETPKESKYFEKVNNVLLANGTYVVEAMGKKAKELGYSPRTYDAALGGYANVVGPAMVKEAKPGEALLAAGETQVEVKHPGKGGRNQDVVVSAIPYLQDECVIISAASDGKDNIEVAGGIADSDWSKQQVESQKINPTQAVELNQSFYALDALEDLLQIEKVTANISDFILVLRGKDEN